MSENMTSPTNSGGEPRHEREAIPASHWRELLNAARAVRNEWGTNNLTRAETRLRTAIERINKAARGS